MKSETVLGLDLGSSSIGWALVRYEQGESVGLIDAGARIFPEGVKRVSGSASIPKSRKRKIARSNRRTLARRRDRRDRLIETLRSVGMLPKDPQGLRAVYLLDPYELRARALDEMLTLHELGRIFLHINRRRGFQSNRRNTEDSEDSKMMRVARWKDEDASRTLGEALSLRYLRGERIRGLPTLREGYRTEFEKIWTVQQCYHPKEMTDRVRTKIADEIIFHQRPFHSHTFSNRNCLCERDEPRCRRDSWWGEEFRVAVDVDRVLGGRIDIVSTDQLRMCRSIVIKQIRKRGTLCSEKIESAVGTELADLIAEHRRNSPDQPDNDSSDLCFRGNRIEAALQSAFGIHWKNASEEQRQAIRLRFGDIDDWSELQRTGHGDWGLDCDVAAKLRAFNIGTGFWPYSEKAIRRILPHMIAGWSEEEARIRAGYQVIRDDLRLKRGRGALPLPIDERGQSITGHPIVRQALFEVRKVVNAIIRTHGRPDRVVVELVREMKQSEGRRIRSAAAAKRNERHRRNAKVVLKEEFQVDKPRGRDVTAVQLWREQGGRCPYTGQEIGPDHLRLYLLGGGALEIDHILPYSRSLDNSRANKVLCFSTANQEKGNRTPEEWLGAGSDRLSQIRDWASRAAKAGMHPGRQSRFLGRVAELDQVIDRYLNDTAYISRMVRKYLLQLYPKREGDGQSLVRVTGGQMTCDLRRAWSLDSLLGADDQKSRNDHRHHAIDAIVVAMTTHRRLHILSRLGADHHKSLPEPWNGFRSEVAARLSKIKVSHRVKRRICGALHEETNYGLTNEPGQFVYRVPVDRLTGTMIGQIRDKTIRKLIRSRCLERGWVPEELGGRRMPSRVFPEDDPVCMPSGVPIRRVRIVTRMRQGRYVAFKRTGDNRPYRAAALQSNHHVEIFERPDRNGRLRYEPRFVSMFEAARRVHRKEAIIQRDAEEGERFVFSLSRGECVLIDTKEAADQLYVVKELDAGNCRIILKSHVSGGASSMIPVLRKSAEILRRLNVRKVSVDPIGRMFPARD
jgi:CRISPR-associated endonuclease Csn1